MGHGITKYYLKRGWRGLQDANAVANSKILSRKRYPPNHSDRPICYHCSMYNYPCKSGFLIDFFFFLFQNNHKITKSLQKEFQREFFNETLFVEVVNLSCLFNLPRSAGKTQRFSTFLKLEFGSKMKNIFKTNNLVRRELYLIVYFNLEPSL